MIRLALVLLLLAGAVQAQEITQGMPVGQPLNYGTAVVPYTATTLAVGKVTANISVPGTQAGDLVFVQADSAAGITVGTVLNPLGDVVTAGTVRITWNTPGLVAVSLGTVNLRIRWMRFPPV